MRSIRWLMVTVVLASLTACGGGASSGSKAQCNDGKDNDGDGMIDFPDDPGCTSTADDSEDSQPAPQCKDGRDNDGDGKTDFPEDPGCYAPNQDDETDDCPDGPMCPQCSNGKDDDGNGETDYPDDTGCASAADNDEYPSNPQACGASVHILSLPMSGDVTGILMSGAASNLTSPTCGGAGTEDVYELRIQKPSVVVATTAMPGTGADTTVYLRGAQCTDPSSELGCDDNVSSVDARSTLVESIATPGTYYVVVDDRSGQGGPYELNVALFKGEGEACTSDECGPGLVCRIPMGESAMVCAKPICSDGVDDDGDGKNDYPDDPGCQSPADNDESDNCPSGAGCPKCSNGTDDDHDMMTDYPADTSCPSAASNAEVCVTADAIGEIVGPTTMGDNTGAADDFSLTCAADTGGLDVAYELELPKLTSFSATVVDPNDFNYFNVAVLGPTCGGTDLSCTGTFDDPATIGPLAAGSYFLVVDGDDDFEIGPFVVTVTGTIAGGQSCESPLAQSGALTCAAGYTCAGTPGSRTCTPTQCNDGMDNNGDGTTDYPNDPGCSSPSDNMEDTVCPGASCPVCSNGTDDDTDMKTDFPMDFGCNSAADTSEAFCSLEVDAPTAITTKTITGTTTGKSDDYTASCATSMAPEVTYVLQLPVPVTTLVINSSGFDTVLSVLDTHCATTIACNDESPESDFGPSEITMNDVAPGNYAVQVDGWEDNEGAYTLTVHGTVAAGTSCASPLFTGANAVLACPTGSTCTGGHCQ